MNATRLLRLDDAEELTGLLQQNRQFMAPWDPLREDSYFTVAKQKDLAEAALEAYATGNRVPLVILNLEGELAGCLNINGIVRGALESAALGYWVGDRHNGNGLATAAVAEAVEIATTELGLHRLQAETLSHNVRSRRVLEKNDFVQYGLAPQYLNIAGRWQDHVMFQRLLGS